MGADEQHTSERSPKRVKDFTTEVTWHAVAYVIVTTLLWLLAPEVAPWVTIGWGIVLIAHILYYFSNDARGSRWYEHSQAVQRQRDKQGGPGPGSGPL